jgi:hypothetical protein
MELEKLRYRWAAMNPAVNGDEQYLGALCRSDLGDFSPDSTARAMREACMPSEVRKRSLSSLFL